MSNQTTPAERLRAAATLLREVAGDATPGPWGVTGCADLHLNPSEPPTGWSVPFSRPANAAYIATMHPPVALALADWLDSTAHDVQHVHDPLYNLMSANLTYALAVADAVLGGEQP